MKEKFEQYCTECGGVLIRIPVPAEKTKIVEYAYGDVMTFPLGTRFNKHTGKRQFGLRVQCVNKRWYNNCTNYIDEDSLHEVDLPELENLKK